MEEESAAFHTPGHEEIELALVRLYRYTKNRDFLDLALWFVNTRGTEKDELRSEYNQSHLPVREQLEAKGHCVRALYLYTAMADLALETGDEGLKKACNELFNDITRRKMYVTGGVGSCSLGENFSNPYDLPNQEAYTETCAGVALIYFCRAMQRLENRAVYGDTIERVLYNGVLSGLSQSGDRFFYENPLEITMNDHFSMTLPWGFRAKRYPITRRPEVFNCSCCPPNLNRLLASLGDYIYGLEGSTLFINQFAESSLEIGEIKASIKTEYPTDGKIIIDATGVDYVAVRIPSWCDAYKLNREYIIKDGYAVVKNDGTKIVLELDIAPFAVEANRLVNENAGRICVQQGPVVYCAETDDNPANLHNIEIKLPLAAEPEYSAEYGLNIMKVKAQNYNDGDDALYRRAEPSAPQEFTLNMIPYAYFANRSDGDMLVWFRHN